MDEPILGGSGENSLPTNSGDLKYSKDQKFIRNVTYGKESGSRRKAFLKDSMYQLDGAL